MVRAEDPSGPIEPLPNPKGVSGGGLWLLDSRTVRADAVWAPVKHLRLVGVQRGWYPRDRTVRVEAATRWREWMHAAITSLGG